jgi:hypothetical protein
MNPIPEVVWDVFGGDKMATQITSIMELGNKKNPRGVYKHYFESIGIEHVSIDWNGQDGALPYDLQQPLPLDRTFDVVTDIGCIEHVEQQEPVWRNVHNFSHGYMVHILPLVNTWKGHGLYKYEMEFLRTLAQVNQYVIEVLDLKDWWGTKPNRICICARFKKEKETSFIWPGNEGIVLQ